MRDSQAYKELVDLLASITKALLIFVPIITMIIIVLNN